MLINQIWNISILSPAGLCGLSISRNHTEWEISSKYYYATDPVKPVNYHLGYDNVLGRDNKRNFFSDIDKIGLILSGALIGRTLC